MNFKKFLLTMVVFTVLAATNMFAQTFYVNNNWGNDANSGTGPGVGQAKKTVSSALLAAPGGSTISVAATGINYDEATPGMNLLPGPLTPGVTGTYTFTSTGGTPVFNNAFQLGTAGTGGTLTFTGPFQFGGLTLTNGTLAGGNQITISNGSLVYRTEFGSITTGQLAFAGIANFQYENTATGAGVTITTGLEFPVVTNVANNLTTTATAGNITLRLDQNRTINGTLTLGAGANNGGADLNTFTLFFNTGALAHTTDGNIINGTLDFTLTGNASIEGVGAARTIPNVNVTSTAANTFTVSPGGALISTVGNVALSGSANLTMQNTGNIGNITHNGAGLLTTAQTAPGTVGNVLMSSTATSAAVIRLNLAGAGTVNTGTVTQSGQGLIHFGGNVTGINTGNVALNTNFALTTAAAQANRGNIYFDDNNAVSALVNVTITGTLRNDAVFSGTTDDAGNGYLGQIIFTNTTNVQVTGTTTVNVTGAITFNAGFSVTGDLGNIIFANATGTANFGAINNTSTFSPGASAGGFRVASFLTNDPNTPTTIHAADVFATFAGGFTAGATTNSSLTDGTAGVGEIELDDITGNATFASITQSALGNGGDIIIGGAAAAAGNLQVNGDITNARTVAGVNIVWGLNFFAAASTLTANSIINSGASNIIFTQTRTGAVTINTNLQQTGTGRIQFLRATTATYQITGSWTVSAGWLEFSGTGVVANGQITVNGPVVLSGGNIDFGNDPRAVVMNNAAIQIGGNSQNVGWPNSDGGTVDTEFRFTQPIPNVTQNITIGGLNQEFPGWINVNNVSAIPAPYVVFQSLYGSAGNPGNLYITYTPASSANGLVFNSTFGGLVNTVRLDNARLFLGKNNPGGSDGGDFQNTTGYSTINNGFVMMSGNVATQVNVAPANAGATFGNFGVDNNALSIAANADVAIATACTFTGDFYLAQGSIANANVGWAATTNVVFNGPAPYPTIYRTEGTFRSAPTFNSLVNVTYYGNDKNTAFEMPAAANRLWNLTVATTNGVQPGFGIVNLNVAGTTVNGTLTINANQSLFAGVPAAGGNLILNGSSAVVNGYLVDGGAGGIDVYLTCPTGTVFTGTGWLPSLEVRAGSVGNGIDSFRGLVAVGFGADNVWGGAGANADDFVTQDGTINYQGGAASSLYVRFIAPVAPNTMNFWNLNTAAGASFTLGANAIEGGGNMNHAAGAIDLGGLTLTHLGTAPAITAGATITNGLLYFSSAATNLTVTGPGTAVIGANFQYDDITDNNAVQTFTFLGASTGNLQINGTLTLSATTGGGDGAQFDIGAGRTLTAGGNVTVGSGSSFIATNGGTTGILLLDAVTPPLVWSTPAASSVTNLTVADDVNLTGGIIGSTLTVGQAAAGAFIHNAGNIDIGTANLQIGNANGTTFTRNAGTYSGTGYLIWNGTNVAGFLHSAVVAAGTMTINNFRLDQPFTMQNGRNLVVVNNLNLNGGSLTNATITAASWLHVGDATNVPVITVNNNFDVLTNALIFDNANADYVFTGTAGTASTRVWPAAASTIPRHVTVNKNAGIIETLGTSRNINGNLFLTEGTLQWDSPVDLAIASGNTITRDAGGALDKNANGDLVSGTLTAPLINLIYTNAVGNTGIEYSDPVVVNNFTLGLPAGSTVSINSSRTIAGTMTWNSTLTFNAATTTNVTLTQTLPALSFIVNNGTVNWNAGITVNGTYTNNNITNVTAGGLAVNGVYINTTVTGTTIVTGTLTGTGAVTNNNVFTLDGLNLTGASNLVLGNASLTTLTGNATIAGFTPPAFIAGGAVEAGATIATNSDLTFGAVAWTGAGNLLNLTFTGTNAQSLALGANRQIGNINMTKGGDQAVTMSGGNLTLNPVQDPIVGGFNQPAGVLTLTRGVFWVGNVVAGTPALLTIQLTTNGGAPGIITNLGYVRNPANNTNLAHVFGRLGVFFPVNTIGRAEWPVGSTTRYRNAAITFTAGNFTIAPTTIIVSHVETAPIGVGENRPEFPLDGGTKVMGGQNWIGGAIPYYWLFEATTSLGAAQQFNVELNGTDMPVVFPDLGNRNHNDLRIIRRFAGNVVANRWYIEGSNSTYTNALYENTPVTGNFLVVVRNIGSTGTAISQNAMFTIGLPSQPPIFTTAAPAPVAMTEATGTTLNTHTRTFTAVDPDVTAGAVTYSYSVVPALPTGATATINANTGVFTFTPGWNGGTNAGTLYTFTITATKGDGSGAQQTLAVTVTNTNRAPDFTATGNSKLADQSITNTSTALTDISYVAPDPDGDATTYALAVPVVSTVGAVPFAGTVTFNNVAGVGKLNFAPVFADAGKTFTLTVTATDVNGGTSVTTALITVTYAQLKGDADLDGTVLALDAAKILQFVVGLYTPTNLAVWNYVSDVNMSGVGDGTVGAIDAAAILYYKSQVPNAWPSTWKSVPVAGDVEFGKMNSDNGNFILPINLSNTSGVRSAYIELELGTSVEFKSVASKLPEGWITASNYNNGKLRIAMSGVNPLADGSVAYINLKLKDKEAVANIQGSASLNDQVNSQLMVKVKEIPTAFGLSQNYPNPFNPTTNIKYSLAENATVTLTIYNMLGQKIKTLVDTEQEAGYYTVRWDGTNEIGSRVSSGVYIYRLSAGNFVSTIKMNLLK